MSPPAPEDADGYLKHLRFGTLIRTSYDFTSLDATNQLAPVSSTEFRRLPSD
jgi:hypothetical protein